MLTIQPAINLYGSLKLPSSIDLFLLSIIIACARKSDICVKNPPSCPVASEWLHRFTGHCTFSYTETGSLNIFPVTNDPSIRIEFDTPDLPWRDLVIGALLSMKKTVVFRTIDEKRIEAWSKQFSKFGFTLVSSPWKSCMCLNFEDTVSFKESAISVEDNDIDACSGLLLGSSRSFTFFSSAPITSPLRHIASLFGYTFDVKSTIPKEKNELVRRIKLMQSKNRNTGSGTQQFSVVLDFSSDSSADTVPIILPGDALLGSMFTAAKCLYPKSAFIIENMPLESWSTPVFQYIRKMGCKISVQENGRTSFGSVGTIQIQSGKLHGRKCECIPLSRYYASLPSLIVIAAFSQGKSVFRSLEDLHNDVPDGIDTLEECIKSLGVRYGEMPDGFVLQGSSDFDGFDVADPFSPAIAGAFSLAATRCVGTSTINSEKLDAYYPDFSLYLKNYFEYGENT